MSFTWFNVSPQHENQLIRYSSDSGKTWNDITFPPGVWDYRDFDQYIKAITKKGENKYPKLMIQHSERQSPSMQTISLT